MKPAPADDSVFSGACWRVRDEYWLKLAGRERSRKKRESREIKSKEVGFKARKKLIVRKRECSARVGRSRTDDYSRVVCVQSEGS